MWEGNALKKFMKTIFLILFDENVLFGEEREKVDGYILFDIFAQPWDGIYCLLQWGPQRHSGNLFNHVHYQL